MPKNNFERLPQDLGGVKQQILDYLHRSEVSALFQTHNFFTKDRALSILLALIAKGKQVEAEKILTRYPELLLEKGNHVTDYSGRTFERVTPFQLALWMNDTHMCRMIIQHTNDRDKLLNQYNELEAHGLKYSTAGGETISKHYDIQPLFVAMEEYLHITDPEQKKHHWCRVVGLLQRDLPAHIMQEYSQKNRPFTSLPDFKTDRLIRGFGFVNCHTGARAPIYPLRVSAHTGLGVNFGLSRGKGRDFSGLDNPTNKSCELDLNALRALNNTRNEEVKEISTILQQRPESADTDSLKSSG